MSTLRIDVESYSTVDLLKCGVDRYIDTPDFEITLFGYAYGDGPANVIDLAQGETVPQHVMRDMVDPATIKKAYNAAFEIATIGKHFGIKLDPAQWRCTSVRALYLGMPGRLADVAKVVGLPEDKQKMGVGYSLIRYFCIPCKPTKANGGRTRNLPKHDPAKWAIFKSYCARDVEVERDVDNKLARFEIPQVEQDLWVLDRKMNDTGILMNTTLIGNAIKIDEEVKARLTAEAMKLTGLSNPSSRKQLLEWLVAEEEDNTIVDLKKATIPGLLENTDNDVVRRVLELRQELSKTSTAKYVAMARGVCSDGAIRGLTQFYGANRTGRWAGRLVQIQNLVSNKLKDLDLARNLVIQGDGELLELLFGTVPDTLSQLIRTAFIARPGHKLVVVDFSAIEARVIAWLAWCQWRLEVFSTHGMIYEASAAAMFKVPMESIQYKDAHGKKHKGPNFALRGKGKIAELALGFQGSVNALITMGALKMGLAEVELEDIKNAWRAANPEIASFDRNAPGLWVKVDNAATKAVRGKTSVTLPIAGGRAKLVFAYEAGFLTIQLPSGRKLFYVKPRIEPEDLYRELASGAKYVVAAAGSLTYEGNDQKTKAWVRLPTYGGKLVENITQAIARDCLREAMFGLDAEGFTQLTTVHDEIICEERIDGPRNVKAAEAVLGRPIAWAPGLLLRGDGFETPYYLKEID